MSLFVFLWLHALLLFDGSSPTHRCLKWLTYVSRFWKVMHFVYEGGAGHLKLPFTFEMHVVNMCGDYCYRISYYNNNKQLLCNLNFDWITRQQRLLILLLINVLYAYVFYFLGLGEFLAIWISENVRRCCLSWWRHNLESMYCTSIVFNRN